MVPKSDTSTTAKPRRSGRVSVPVQIAPVYEAPIKKAVKSALSSRKASRPSLKRSESLSSLSTDSSLSPPPEKRSKLDQRSLRFLQILYRPLAMPDGTQFFPKEVGSVSHIAARFKKARGHVERSLHAMQSNALPNSSRLSTSSPSSLSSLDSTTSPSTLQSPPLRRTDSDGDAAISSAHALNAQAAPIRDAHTEKSNKATRRRHKPLLDTGMCLSRFFSNSSTRKLGVPLAQLIGPGTPKGTTSKQACRALYDLHPDRFAPNVLKHLELPKNHARQPLQLHERDEIYNHTFAISSNPRYYTQHQDPLAGSLVEGPSTIPNANPRANDQIVTFPSS